MPHVAGRAGPLSRRKRAKVVCGYDVIVWTAPDANPALEFVAHVHFDCVLIDATVWQNSQGAELARRIGWQYPKIQVALTTGLDADELEAPPGVPVFQKPYRFDAIVASFCGGLEDADRRETDDLN